MIKVKISEVKPTTSGWSKTLEFPGDQIAKGQIQLNGMRFQQMVMK